MKPSVYVVGVVLQLQCPESEHGYFLPAAGGGTGEQQMDEGMKQLKQKLDKLGLQEIDGPHIGGTLDLSFLAPKRDDLGWLERFVARVQRLAERVEWR